jgi:peptidoglycan/xylan/chitin deacetylase (PgdA/CDA1 family)
MLKRIVKTLLFKSLNALYARGFGEEAIPILCYHSIPDQHSFERQMAGIREAGYSVVSMGELVGWLSHRVPLKLPAMVLTFDDGYMSQFLNAVPVLTRFNYPATFFVVTQRIGKHSDWKVAYPGMPAVPRLPLMGALELSELLRRGFEVGCHSRTHPHLRKLASDAQRLEIQTAKQELEDLLRADVRFYCYPYGEYNTAAVALAKASGFLAAVSTHPGAVHPADDFFILNRLCVPDEPIWEEFQAYLKGAVVKYLRAIDFLRQNLVFV